MVSAPVAGRGWRLSACHMRCFSGAGPAFAVSVPHAILGAVGLPLSRIHGRERRSPAFGMDPTVVSQLLAGSPLVDPGGARRRPGSRCASATRRDTAPSPAVTNASRSAPLEGRGEAEFNGGMRGGDHLGDKTATPSAFMRYNLLAGSSPREECHGTSASRSIPRSWEASP
jgi:hypothetical protein